MFDEEPVRCWLVRVRSANDLAHEIPLATRLPWPNVIDGVLRRRGIFPAPRSAVDAVEITAGEYLNRTL